MTRAVLTRHERARYLTCPQCPHRDTNSELLHTHALHVMLRPALLRSTQLLHTTPCHHSSRIVVRTIFRLSTVQFFPRVPRPGPSDAEYEKRPKTFIEELAKEQLHSQPSDPSEKPDGFTPRSDSFRAEVIKEDPAFEQPKFQDGIGTPKILKHVAVSCKHLPLTYMAMEKEL